MNYKITKKKIVIVSYSVLYEITHILYKILRSFCLNYILQKCRVICTLNKI